MLTTTILTAVSIVAQTSEEITGTSYYISTINGKDSNLGTNKKYSLQELSNKQLEPSDKIYLERGSNFYNDYLYLYNIKGTEKSPIVFDVYGDENQPLPKINTNGEGIWFQNYGKELDNRQHKNFGYVSSAILLYDCEYIELNNITITNKRVKIDTVYNALDAMNRTGVAVVAQNGGTLDHIYLKNLDIRDV